ncbi:histone-like nucleoid-structuring protein Lsr2 [Microlunatus speluncae]|uniref:histone-like nucleoid-structuring protein Lsr2 n=1 Tax=Microlunatus speluncae TaxID=2594267 RepID=UPI00126651D6|nr:Lsr2 family protein [Microlunatus speluncae]
MARRVEITLQDDLDGTGADETVTFALDGVDYEIDLSTDNATKLRSVFEPYAERARRTGTRRGGVSTFVTALPPANSTLRAWGQARGYRVPDRGRIPAEVKKAYAEAEQVEASNAG